MDAYLILSDSEISLAVRRERGNTEIFLFESDLTTSEGSGLKQFFFDQPLLSLPYRSTHICIVDESSYALIPQDLGHAATPEQWLSVVTELGERQVLTEEFSQEQITLAYSISRELYDFCQRSFSLPSYGHTAKPLISSAIMLSRKGNGKLIMAQYRSHTLDIIVAEQGHLLLANRYKVLGESDLLYYLTAVIRQYRLSPEEDTLYFYTRAKVEQLENSLRESFEHVYMNHYPRLKVSPDLSLEVPTPFVLNLLCE